ncbi:MAG: hydroxyacid dehydrogenase, partial [Anaerolineae bacterium]|nr:hydroxyacid dehydrogenase [Anaerolineae bacterium]
QPDTLKYLRGQLHESVHLTVDHRPDPANHAVLIAGRPTREQLESSPNLQMLLIPFAGLPVETRVLMRDYPQIAVHNLHHNAVPTAEMALALLMSAARRLIPSDQRFRQHDWTPRYEPYPSRLLHGKTALILGYGAVGQHLGAILRVMGMTVLGIRRRASDAASGIYTLDALHDLLPRADVLIVALPGTESTEGLLGEREIRLLPQQSILVNIGRAAIVDQQALYDALRDGHLFGAGLDVWYNYPPDEASRVHTPPAGLPFHELDNVVLSPHRGGGGGNAEIEVLRMDALATMLNSAARGEPLPNRVDLAAGY